MVDLSGLESGIRSFKGALDIARTLRDLLPAGEQREDAERKIDEATAALAASEAQMAKALGYKLCQCTFPPQIMLWKQAAGVFQCPNDECGHTVSPPSKRQTIRSTWLERS